METTCHLYSYALLSFAHPFLDRKNKRQQLLAQDTQPYEVAERFDALVEDLKAKSEERLSMLQVSCSRVSPLS